MKLIKRIIGSLILVVFSISFVVYAWHVLWIIAVMVILIMVLNKAYDWARGK